MIFLGDIFLIVVSVEKIKLARDSLILLLQNLDFSVSIKKLILQPT